MFLFFQIQFNIRAVLELNRVNLDFNRAKEFLNSFDL